MHYFSIHGLNDEHLGFLIIQKNHKNAKQGQLAIKCHHHSPHDNILKYFESQRLLWQQTNHYLTLLNDAHCPIGRLHQDKLTLNDQHFIINDLTGSI